MTVKITGIGSYIPEQKIANADFSKHVFLKDDGTELPLNSDLLIGKFKSITGIEERRYVNQDQVTSDIALIAAERAIADAKIDREQIDYIIVAHNFGDVPHGTIQSDMVPSIASRVKHQLKIRNPKCVAYDILFGCPGWIEGVLHANAFIKSGMAHRCLVIGAETLSRVVDPHDRDSMIYSDGAGASIVEASQDNSGILTHESATHSFEESAFLFFGNSNNKSLDNNTRYLKMFGRKIYEFALTHVPQAMKSCLDKAGLDVRDVKKILIHQANEKMDEAIVDRFYKLYDQQPPDNIMPMCISYLGNSSVATVPTLFDLVLREQLENHRLHSGDIILFASVGAGMNINAIAYRF